MLLLANDCCLPRLRGLLPLERDEEKFYFYLMLREFTTSKTKIKKQIGEGRYLSPSLMTCPPLPGPTLRKETNDHDLSLTCAFMHVQIPHPHPHTFN